jgi:YbbR domain-containing protein
MNRLPGFVTRNFRLKVGCAVLAVITWTGVVYAGNPPQTKIVSVPVPQQASSIPAKFVLIHKIDDLRVRLGGTRDSLNAFDPSDIDITVNWKAVKQGGLQSIPISVSNANSKVELLDAPASVQANIDTRGSVTVTVNIQITSPPPPGILPGARSVSPATVVAVGPQHELTGMFVRASVDLSTQRANFQQLVNIFPFDSHGNKLGDVELDQSQVTVSITLSSSITSRVVAVTPVIVGRQSSGFVVTGVRYSPTNVTLSGPQDLLNTIDSVTTSQISINNLTGNVTLFVPLQLPSGVDASASSITVTILVAPIPTPAPSPTPVPTPGPT